MPPNLTQDLSTATHTTQPSFSSQSMPCCPVIWQIKMIILWFCGWHTGIRNQQNWASWFLMQYVGSCSPSSSTSRRHAAWFCLVQGEVWYLRLPCLQFLPVQRYASAGICYGISICLSVSHACFVSKRLNILSKFFYHLIAPSFHFFVRGSLLRRLHP